MEKLKQTFTKNGYEYSLIDRTTDHYFYKVLHTEAELKGKVVGYEIGLISDIADFVQKDENFGKNDIDRFFKKNENAFKYWKEIICVSDRMKWKGRYRIENDTIICSFEDEVTLQDQNDMLKLWESKCKDKSYKKIHKKTEDTNQYIIEKMSDIADNIVLYSFPACKMVEHLGRFVDLTKEQTDLAIKMFKNEKEK